MPTGGSKKGEHRGTAKREAKKRGLPKGQTNNPNGRPKGSTNRAIRERLAILGAEIGVAELDGLMPKQCMLDIMRTFTKMAMDENTEMIAKEAELSALLISGVAADGLSLEDKEKELRSRIYALSAAFERHIVLAGDMAYKAASYYHPRLQALVVKDAGDQSAGDVLRQMLDEIDDEDRVQRAQVRQIEHAPLLKDMN